jgi:hypothetical protein
MERRKNHNYTTKVPQSGTIGGEIMKTIVKEAIRDQKGAALTLVLILLVLGGLIMAPLLGLMSAGLMSGRVYENNMYVLYAADAGVDDGLWQVRNVELADRFPDYDEYDYSMAWEYYLDDHQGGVAQVVLLNDKSVHITIENVWIPKDIPAPDAATAEQIIEEGKLVIAGNPSLTGASTYEIKISYDPCGGAANAQVLTLGIWLPPGFEYDDNCSLEGKVYYSEPDVTPYKGGYAVVWDFVSSVLVKDFPDTVTFQYSGPQGQTPGAALSWIVTTGDYYTWDADVRVYKIISTATDPDTGKQTTVESYTSKVKPRKMGSAISGDYFAIGNTLMTCTGSSCPLYRNILFKESSATVANGDIPSNAVVEAAYLYWSGWIEGDGAEQTIFQDNCSDFNAPPMLWSHGTSWDTYSGRFRGTAYNKGSSPGRYLTMGSSVDLSAYAGETVEIHWQQDEDGDLEDSDRLYYAFSADGGSTWSADYEAFRNDNPPSNFSNTIPDQYLTNNFRMRFYLYGFSEGSRFGQTEYCYIDDIIITATVAGVESAKVNRVMFGTTGSMTEITTDQWQVAPTPDAVEGSWCYRCFYDATDIVRDDLDPNTKSGTFTLGHVLEGSGYNLDPSGMTGYPLGTPALRKDIQYQWSYAGWSLIIIYSSPETKGHQLYLFDTLRYVAVHTTLDFPISGFLVPDPVEGEQNAARITCFVGDGDEHYPYDFIALLSAEPSVPSYQIPDSYKLWDGITCSHNSAGNPNNVWNSQSVGLTASGIDIDTFSVPWSSGLLQPGDTSAWIILGNASSNPNDAELIMVVYIIFSFRSAVTTGDVMGYLIRG